MVKSEVAVIGCGIAGLTSGLKLLEAGFGVTIFARELPPQTTSDVAAAFWYPDGAAPAERVQPWALASYEALVGLMGVAGSGVSFKPLVELYAEPTAPPDWFAWVDGFETAVTTPQNLHGYRLIVPAIDTPIYMPFLQRRFLAQGGKIQQRTVAHVGELPDDFSCIVNCAGVWAHEVVRDTAVTPIRGQIIRVRKPAGLPDEIVHMDDEEFSTYIVPRSQDCVLGGSKQKGNWNLQIDDALAQDILARCVAIQPMLRGVEILEHRVGLRPGRPEVRLELEVEEMGGGTAVIHNYGHGAIGHTLAWGCAAEVVQLVSQR